MQPEHETTETCPPKGAAAGSRHWLWSELMWCWTSAVWDGSRWHVDGFRDPQRPEDMIEEWTDQQADNAGGCSEKPSEINGRF